MPFKKSALSVPVSLIVFLFFKNTADAQSCSLVNSININTGYNYATNALIPIGQADTNWKIAALSPTMSHVPSVGPIGSGTTVVSAYPGWASNSNSGYISSVNNGTNGFNTNIDSAAYTMTVTRSFRVIATDNYNYNFNVAGDNDILVVSIDGGPSLITPTYSHVDYAAFKNFTFTRLLSPGIHTITITLQNFNTAFNYVNNDNWFGLNVWGTITSNSGNNSIVSVTSPGNCITCTTLTSTIDTTICQGKSYLGHNTTGTYIDTLINSSGCDSIRTLHLTVTNCNLTCTNWLSTPSLPSYVDVGQVNVSGNQLTVEATINRTQPYNVGTGDGSDGDVVSKHLDPSNVNYLLRPNHAYITTTNGFFATPDPCPFQLNKTYHIAMVYDGTTLKFYRDGFLMSQVAATGNLYQNTFPTRIGLYTGAVTENFLGYINEVRIWNVARTQVQIRSYMNTSLPNPSTQTGLLAYYIFNDLLNKQGNTAFNGTISGSASINASNPNCAYTPDSCCTSTSSTIDTSICQGKSYLGYSTSGTYIDTLINSLGCDSIRTLHLVVTSGVVGFTAPDTVCVNSTINAVNTSTCASSYYWSFCTTDATSSPNAVNLGNPGDLLQTPVFSDFSKDANGHYYVLVVNNTYYANQEAVIRLDFGNSLLNTPTAVSLGNFNQGLMANDEGIQLENVNGHWYAIIVGGDPNNPGSSSSYISKLDFGNSLANTPTFTNWGNLGGLNYPHDLYVFQNGSNWYGLTVNSNDGTITRFNFGTDFSGIPTGVNLGNFGAFKYPTGVNPLFINSNWYVFAASHDDSTLVRMDFGNSLLNNPTIHNLGTINHTLAGPWDIYITKPCDSYTGFVINADKNSITRLDFGDDITNVPTGTLLGNIGSLSFPHSISKFFRVGSDLYSFITNATSSTITRLQFAGCTNSSIPSSTQKNPPAFSYNAPGIYHVSLTIDDSLPSASTFCKDIVVLPPPPVKTNNDTSICNGKTVQLNTIGANSYSWTPVAGLSDPGIANPVATVTATTKYIVTGINAVGCAGKDTVTINIQNVSIKANRDTNVCIGNSVQMLASGANSYSWSPSTYLSDNLIANPIANPLANIQYVVTGFTTIGCSTNDTVNVTVNPLPSIVTTNDTSICQGTSAQLNTTGASTYSWIPTTAITNSAIANPVVNPVLTTQYIVTGTDAVGCKGKDTVNININPKPTITKSKDTSICNNSSVQLFASGGISYQWTPAGSVNNPNIANPVVSPTSNTVYYVNITDANTCSNSDSIKVSIKPLPNFTISPNQNICTTAPAQLNASGGDVYLWSPSSSVSNATISNPLATATSTTTYTVSITESACHNSTTLSTVVTILPPLTLSVTKSNDLDCSNGSAKLTASGADFYSWSPATGLNDASSATPVASPLSSQTYILKGESYDGCIGYDSITVYTNFTDNKSGYYMPNAFSPNGDGLNDCFGIKYWGVVQKLEFFIYDRWGNEVFRTSDPNACWDGTYKSQAAAAGNYVYYIKATTACGSFERKGNVILVR